MAGFSFAADEQTTRTAPLSVAMHPYRFLGSYRFLLALCVFTSHASGFLGEAVASLSLGNVGVFLFFVVSGAVICEALDIFYRDSSRRFLINRALKIFPAYWAAVVLYAVVLLVLNPGEVDFSAWTVLVNVSLLLSYVPAGNNVLLLDIAWAVAVECQFYLIAAALFFGAHRTKIQGHVLFAGGLAALGAYLFVHLSGGQTRFYGSLRYAPYFVFGCSLYYAFTRHDWRVVLLAIASAFLSLHEYLVYAMATPPGGLPPEAAAYRAPQLLSMTVFAAGSIVFVWLFSRRFPRGVEKVDKRLGDFTYAMYLIHPLVIFVAIKLELGIRLGGWLAYLFTLSASLALAALIFRFIERPVMRFRNRFRGQRLYD